MFVSGLYGGIEEVTECLGDLSCNYVESLDEGVGEVESGSEEGGGAFFCW